MTATDTETAVRTQTETIDADEPPEPAGIDADTRPDTTGADGTPPVLVDVRVGSHAGTTASTSVTTEVVPGGWFEGYLDGFVGVTGEQPFRVQLFEDPTRVALDVEQ